MSPDDELNQIKESVSEELNGAKEIQTQTEQKTEKHVHFEDSISLTDSTLDPPLDDPSDEVNQGSANQETDQESPKAPSENGDAQVQSPESQVQNEDNSPDKESS